MNLSYKKAMVVRFEWNLSHYRNIVERKAAFVWMILWQYLKTGRNFIEGTHHKAM